ncbi:MAG: hypothetical protein AB8B55_08420 [Mariniblastus sp.]
MTLNQELDFKDAADDIKAAFTGRVAKKVMLNSGHQLYKFTQYSLSHHGKVTPWWSSVKPVSANDTGLELLLQRSSNLGVSPAEFARARNAVTNQWNSMTGLLIAQLKVPVYGFVGGVAHQRLDEGDSKVVFIGGAVQLWIPNLTPILIKKT